MRQSNRPQILEAAIRVVEREGVTAITFDSVAAEANVTRGGMMYHFPSREDLLLAIHQQLADQWEQSLESSAGKSAAEASPAERADAYARVATESANRAELLLLLDSSTSAALNKPWEGVLTRWGAPPPKSEADAAEVARFISRLASDGLWMYEALTRQPLSKKVRQMIAERLRLPDEAGPSTKRTPRKKTPASNRKRT